MNRYGDKNRKSSRDKRESPGARINNYFGSKKRENSFDKNRRRSKERRSQDK